MVTGRSCFAPLPSTLAQGVLSFDTSVIGTSVIGTSPRIEVFAVVDPLQADKATHFGQPRVDSSIRHLPNLFQRLVGRDHRKALFAVASVYELVEDFHLPLGAPLNAEIVEDEVRQVTELVDDPPGLAVGGAFFGESVAQLLEILPRETEKPAWSRPVQDQLIQHDTGHQSLAPSGRPVQQETALWLSVAVDQGGHVPFDLLGSRHGGTVGSLQEEIVLKLPPVARWDVGARESCLQTCQAPPKDPTRAGLTAGILIPELIGPLAPTLALLQYAGTELQTSVPARRHLRIEVDPLSCAVTATDGW